MITVTFKSDDLTRLRFIHSPLVELVMSYHTLYQANSPAIYHQWIEASKVALRTREFPYMRAVLIPHRATADFLLNPYALERQLEEGFARLRQTSEEEIRRSVQQLLLTQPRTFEREMFLQDPHIALECLIDEMRTYWQITLAPYWSRITPLIETELMNRGRVLALSGPECVLGKLADNASYDHDQHVLTIDKPSAAWLPPHHTLNGNGAMLVPLMFKHQSSFHLYPSAQPVVIYSAAGTGLWQSAPKLELSDSLRVLMGDSKARIIVTLAGAHYHTGELAHRLHVTPGAISQQLQQLYQAGIVETHRVGKHVFYRLSPRGESLLTLFNS